MMHYRNPRFTLHYITYTNFIFTFLVALFQWELGQEWNYDAMGPTGVVCRGSGVGGKGQNYMKLVAHKMMRNNYNTVNKVHIVANELPQLLSQSTNVWRASDRTKSLSDCAALKLAEKIKLLEVEGGTFPTSADANGFAITWDTAGMVHIVIKMCG